MFYFFANEMTLVFEFCVNHLENRRKRMKTVERKKKESEEEKEEEKTAVARTARNDERED